MAAAAAAGHPWAFMMGGPGGMNPAAMGAAAMMMGAAGPMMMGGMPSSGAPGMVMGPFGPMMMPPGAAAPGGAAGAAPPGLMPTPQELMAAAAAGMNVGPMGLPMAPMGMVPMMGGGMGQGFGDPAAAGMVDPSLGLGAAQGAHMGGDLAPHHNPHHLQVSQGAGGRRWGGRAPRFSCAHFPLGSRPGGRD